MRFAALFLALLVALAPASARTLVHDAYGGDYPRIGGTWHEADGYPRVFTTRAELAELARRVGRPGSFSAANFAELEKTVARDLAGHNDWSVAYSGCNIEDYLYAFSYDDAHSAQIDRLRTDLHLRANATPPLAAALVASRDALYAALVRAGASANGGPSPEAAAALSRKILIAWANHGFRLDGDRYPTSNMQFCDARGAHVPAATSGVGLQISRGVVYSADAQDLLQSLDVLDASDVRALDGFHRAMFDLIHSIVVRRANTGIPCNRYGNHGANDLAALVAISRLLGSQRMFDTTLYGGDGISPTVSWTGFFANNVYGRDQKPNACYHNTGPNGPTSKPFFQTPFALPGEIDDRFRNAEAAQGIGYPMFSLQRLFNAAQVMREAGLDGYGYRGPHGQSLRAAADFYACYATRVGYGTTVTERNGAGCGNLAQYVGKTASGFQQLLYAASVYPDDPALAAAAKAAQAVPRATIVDALNFGHWPD